MSQENFQCLISDIKGSEGPCTTVDGRIYMVQPGLGEVLEIVNGQARVVANTGGKPAGLQLARDGRLWISDMAKGILSVSPEGDLRDEVVEFEGAPIRGCNDLAFDRAGNLYFTAPAGSSADKPEGEIFCRLAHGEVRRLDGGYRFCNGLAVSSDDRLLIVAETFTRELQAYDLSAPGVVGPKKLWATLPGEARAGADGLDFDSHGRLIATNYGVGELNVFDPEGKLLRRIKPPFGKVSNVHFMGPHSTQLLVTEHETNGLWVFDYGSTGQRQFGWD